MKKLLVKGIALGMILVLCSCTNILQKPCETMLAPYGTRDQFNEYVDAQASGSIHNMPQLTEREVKTRKQPFEVMELVIKEMRDN